MKFTAETTVVRERRGGVAVWCLGLALLLLLGLFLKLPKGLDRSGHASMAGPSQNTRVSAAITVATTRALNPLESRQNEIIANDAGEPGDPQLDREYLEISERHFGGKLPATPVLWEPRLGELGPLIAAGFKQEGLTAQYAGRLFVLLNPDLAQDPRQLKRTLCHEMVHIYLFRTGDTQDKHGPAFQNVLRRLSDEGAFEGEWASKSEKVSLRAWIDAEAARLDREGADLNREVSELNDRVFRGNRQGRGWPSKDEMEAAKNKRDLFNRRVVDFNARTAQLNADQAGLSERVNRYNLMMSYPDGLDEESAVGERLATEQSPLAAD